MRLVIGYVSGKERKIAIDSFEVSEELGCLKAYKDDLQIGMFSFNQVCYWFVEDWWLITSIKTGKSRLMVLSLIPWRRLGDIRSLGFWRGAGL